jgi:hypothetical protein
MMDKVMILMEVMLKEDKMVVLLKGFNNEDYFYVSFHSTLMKVSEQGSII